MQKLVIFIGLLLQGVSFAQEKPNILWVTFEDTSPRFLGCYGNPHAKTPVMDSLANNGVRFKNAFSTGTVCAPSRSTLIMGVRTFVSGTGNHRSHYPIPEFIHGFPLYLQQAGYYTSNNYKTDYNVKNAKEFIKEAWNESSNSAGWWNRKPGQPFFAVFNFVDSHQSRTMTNPYEFYEENVLNELPPEDRIGENEFLMPPIYKDSPEMRKQFARVYNSIKLTDNKMGDLLKKLRADGLAENTIIFCFADHGEGMPRGKTNGIDYGYRVPLMIWVPEKYRSLIPWKPGEVTNELISFEDMAPTVLNIAGVNIPEYMKGRVIVGDQKSQPVEFLELSNDRSGNGIDMVRSITNGKYMYSRNYYPFMPETRYIRYMEIGAIKQQMRNDLADNKLNDIQRGIFEPRPAEFFYNLEKDPWELSNLVNDPASQGLLNTFRSELDKRVLQSRDILFLPEYEIREISKYTTPYEYRLDEKKYPFTQIYNVASLSGKKGVAIANKQVEYLTNPNKIVRYWAVVGLRSQSAEILTSLSKNAREKILASIKDTYPPVSITAAAIAHEFYQNEDAKKNLIETINGTDKLLSLLTIHYLQYSMDKTPFIDSIRKVSERKKNNHDLKGASLDFLGSLGLIENDFEHR